MTDSVLLGMVDGTIPFVLTRSSIVSFRCSIPVLPGGDGATTEPLEKRTARCTHRTPYLIGQAPTCEHHIRQAAVVARGDEPDWSSVSLAHLPWPLYACPPFQEEAKP